MNSKSRDIGVGLFFLAFAAFLWFSIPSQVVASWSSFGVGSRGFPRLATAVMGFFGFLLTLTRLVGAQSDREKRVSLDEHTVDEVTSDAGRVLPKPTRFSIVLSIMIGYSLLLEIVGFEIATFLATFATMAYLGARPIWKPLIISALTTALVSFVFARFMEVVLPGPFWS